VLHQMEAEGVMSDDYPKQLSYLERLNKLKQQHKRQPVSLDAVVTSLASIAGVLIIAAFEVYHPWTSKADRHIVRPGKN